MKNISHGDQAHSQTGSHGTFGTYMVGFGLSVILTAIPFWLVMTHKLGNAHATELTIMALAVIQIFVHMIFFLHMNTKSEGGWSMMALIFTLTMVVIVLSGSMWVMYHLNANMMPSMESPNMMMQAPGPHSMPMHDMGQMP